MTGLQGLHALCFLALVDFIFAENEFMVSKAEQITLEKNFETKLICEMNIEPDKFQWKFYPTNDHFNVNAEIDLSTSHYRIIMPDKRIETKNDKQHLKQRKKSSLTIVADSEQKAGDYQCLAHYGAFVVASVPWRITFAKLNRFPYQRNQTVFVTEGNTVSWRCLPPQSNPEAYIDYYRDNRRIDQPFAEPQLKSLLLQNVSYLNSGQYSCTATLNNLHHTSSTTLSLKVGQDLTKIAPYFIMEPRSKYEVNKGDIVFLDCAAVGNPVPSVVWKKHNGVLPEDRSEMTAGGLIIKNVTASDGGVYECVYKNDVGTVSHSITVRYHEEPVINCAHAGTVLRIQQARHLEIKCNVTGSPEPKVVWLLNGFSVKNDSKINATAKSIYFKPIEKRHAGNLQIFARNSVKTIYKSISLRVVPLSTSDIPKNSHRHGKTNKNGRKFAKHGKNKNLEMIPPSKPVITRVNDETVMVRWQVNDNEGLPIRFFKVQYRELGPAGNYSNRSKGWKTMNADIPPTSKDYEVKNLKPDYIYKFRVAAVYSNDDNNNSVNSDKFHLRRLDFEERNPLPVPTIVRAVSLNSSSVKIFWEYTPNPNITVEGFYISYLSSSKAGDFMTATVDGAHVTSHIISHLQPDMFYDFKLQTFNSKSASEFSPIMAAKTKALPVVATTPNPSTHVTPTTTKTTTNKLYIFVAVGVVVAALIVSLVVILFVCRKWKQKKSLDNNKGPVDDHHIQADGNEYVVSPKTLPRANGCGLPTNRITITANPLADADNKNQNLIEMSCMTAQNNNLTQQPVPPTPPPPIEETAPVKNRDKTKRNKRSLVESGENYV